MSVRRPATTGPATWLGFAAVAALFLADFAVDVHARDAFSWMDPYQYYDFARGVWTGSEPLDGFEIPSILPFFVVPLLAVEASVRCALWLNAASMALLLYALFRLCRELEFETPAPVVAALVLSSPLLLGLSRTLYSEFTLAAWMALAFSFWLRFLRRGDLASGFAYGAVFAVAFMIKLTLPVFMLLPVAGAALAFGVQRDFARCARVLYVAALPIAAGVAIHVNAFAPSLGYYVTVARTELPFMRLMGPVDWCSWASATYYLREIGETFLWLLTPFLVLAIWRPGTRSGSFAWRDLAGPRAALWLWLLSPVVLLVFHPLKEPRHAAASVVPAVLLVVAGIEDLPRARLRTAARAIALCLALLQYGVVVHAGVETPYYLDRPLELDAIREAMEAADPHAFDTDTPAPLRRLRWNYNQNVVLSGFGPNEALALTWQTFPGVTFDLDVFDDPDGDFEPDPYPRFEDLFFLSGINAYNRRCGWHRYQPTLSRETVVENADIVIANDLSREQALARFPHHAFVATVPRGSGEIQVLRAAGRTRSYRALYARASLARFPELGADERRVIARELVMQAILAGDSARARQILEEFRDVANAPAAVRNIYWIGGYPALIDFASARAAQLAPARGRSG